MTTPPDAAPPVRDEWAAPPLIAGDWRELELREALPLLLRYAQRAETDRLRRLFVDHWPARVRAMRPSFYPGWILAEAQATLPDGAKGLLAFLYGPQGIVTIDGRSDPIHDVNGNGAFAIPNEAVALDYLRFFCSAIHGEEGRFQIVESTSDLLPGDEAGAREGVIAVGEALVPATVRSRGDQYIGEGHVLYGGSLFRAVFDMAKWGGITMVDDTPVARLGVRRELFRPPFRIVGQDTYDF